MHPAIETVLDVKYFKTFESRPPVDPPPMLLRMGRAFERYNVDPNLSMVDAVRQINTVIVLTFTQTGLS